MPPTISEPVELAHAIRHMLEAREALNRGEPCAARAHLREAQADIRWTLKPVTAACSEYTDVSYLRDDERCTRTTKAGTRCMGRRYDGTDTCFAHAASEANRVRREAALSRSGTAA